MNRAGLAIHIEAFRTEALMLLRFQFAFDRIFQFQDMKNISRSDFVDRLIALKAIENDILIRICKFDDNTKGVHSFNKAIKEVSNSHPRILELNCKIKQFRQLIEEVKLNRRHLQLAHLKIGAEDNEYQLRFDFKPALKLIIEIIDLMSQNKANYLWSDGHYEEFNLRKEVLNEEIDAEN
jgi:prepilin-type processing-associated H-X9-DG protein